MKKDIFVENFIKEIEDKRKREKRSKIKKISIFITVILLIAFAGFMVFAFPSGIERPTYCLDCKENNVHNRLFKDRTDGYHALWVLKR